MSEEKLILLLTPLISLLICVAAIGSVRRGKWWPLMVLILPAAAVALWGRWWLQQPTGDLMPLTGLVLLLFGAAPMFLSLLLGVMLGLISRDQPARWLWIVVPLLFVVVMTFALSI